jgi:hypothetical protein
MKILKMSRFELFALYIALKLTNTPFALGTSNVIAQVTKKPISGNAFRDVSLTAYRNLTNVAFIR